MGSENKSVFGMLGAAIKALCMMLINLVTVADEGIAMADKAVRVAREQQAIDFDLSTHQYKHLAVRKAAVVQQKLYDETNSYVKQQDPDGSKGIGKLIDSRILELEAVAAKAMTEVNMSRARRSL